MTTTPPFNPEQPGYLAPMGAAPSTPSDSAAMPPTPSPAPSKRGLLTSKPVIGIAALVLGVTVGAASGGSGDAGSAASVPAATVTATVTATAAASVEPTAEATEVETAEATATESTAPEPAKASYATLSARKFKLLAKDPDAYVGKTYVVYGEITQFDSATGTDTFRADTGPKKLRISYGYTDYDQNSLFTGDEAKLKKLVEGDCFKAKVTVSGSYSYDTQAGGNTTVPLFQVDSISVYGSTD